MAPLDIVRAFQEGKIKFVFVPVIHSGKVYKLSRPFYIALFVCGKWC